MAVVKQSTVFVQQAWGKLKLKKVAVQIKIFLFGLLFIVMAAKAYSQTDEGLQSLRNKLAVAEEDSFKCILLNDLGRYFRNKDAAKSLAYSEEAAALAHKLQWKRGMMLSLIEVAWANIYKGDFPAAMTASLEAQKLMDGSNDTELMWQLDFVLGELFRRIGNQELSLAYNQKCLALAKSMYNDQMTLTSTLALVVNYYYEQNWLAGDTLLKEGFSLAIRLNDTMAQARIFELQAGSHLYKGNLVEARDDFLKVLSLLENTQAHHNIAFAYSQLAGIYNALHNRDSAMLYANTALQTAETFQLKKELYDAHIAWFQIDTTYSNYKSAVVHYLKADSLWRSDFNMESAKLIQVALSDFAQEKKDAQVKLELDRQRFIRNLIVGGLAIALILLAVIFNQRQKMKHTSEQLRISLMEKEALLREIHHRVKNNLEVISSLLTLQTRNMTDETGKAALAEGQSRVQSIALIHHKLYRTDDLGLVELHGFVKDLFKQVKDVFNTPETQVDLTINDGELWLSTEASVPFGLILNELFTNIFKYAVQPGRLNTINVSLQEAIRHDAVDYHFICRDNGPGLPIDFDPEKSMSMGMKVIRLLTRQLHGRSDFYNDEGMVFELFFSRKGSGHKGPESND